MDAYEIEQRACHFSAFNACAKGLHRGAWPSRHRSNPAIVRTKDIKDTHNQVFSKFDYQYKILVNRNPWKILLQRPFSIIIPCCLARPGMGPTGITLKALKGFDWKSIYKKFNWLPLVGGQLVCIMLAAASGANFCSHHQVICCQKYICSHPFLC